MDIDVYLCVLDGEGRSAAIQGGRMAVGGAVLG